MQNIKLPKIIGHRGASGLAPENTLASIKKAFNKLRTGNNESWPSYFYFKKKKYIIKIFKADDRK